MDDPPPRLFGLLLILVVSVTAYPKAAERKGNNCEEFSHGVTFNETDAIGSWFLLHCWTGQAAARISGCGNRNCLEFQRVNSTELDALTKSLEKHIDDIKWDTITMKMTIPCIATSNSTHNYYLENLGDDGSYKTLELPDKAKLEKRVKFLRSHLRMKMIKGKYLTMMDCKERFAFLLGRNEPKNQELEPDIKEMIKSFFEYDS